MTRGNGRTLTSDIRFCFYSLPIQNLVFSLYSVRFVSEGMQKTKKKSLKSRFDFVREQLVFTCKSEHLPVNINGGIINQCTLDRMVADKRDDNLV